MECLNQYIILVGPASYETFATHSYSSTLLSDKMQRKWECTEKVTWAPKAGVSGFGWGGLFVGGGGDKSFFKGSSL